MDSRLIEVALGLVLVILLTSLLATALQEGWTSLAGTRGKVLRRALVSFLADDTRLAQALMSHPLLVSLSPQEKGQHDKRRPSYIGADSVVAALMQHLVATVGGSRPASPVELVHLVQARLEGARGLLGSPAPGLPSRDFVQGLAALVQGVEDDWPAFEARVGAWYDTVGERSTGWFKREIQVKLFILGFLIAGAMNINPLVIATRLWEDEPMRRALANAAERVHASSLVQPAAAAQPQPGAPADAAASPPGTASQVHAAWTQALERYTGRLAEVMNRSPLGGPATALLLQAGDAAYDLFDATAQWQKAPPALVAGELGRLKTSLDRAMPNLPVSDYAALNGEYERLREVAASLWPDEAPRKTGCTALEGAARQACEAGEEFDRLQELGLPIGWTREAYPSFSLRCLRPPAEGRSLPSCDPPGFGQAGWWSNAGSMAAGWLLMAIACTLGGPFWFDMLGKLVRIRATGKRPEQAETGEVRSAGSGPGLLTRTPQPAGAAAPANPAAQPVPMSDALNDAERRLAASEIQRIQRRLGLGESEAGGYFDGVTRRAIQNWQAGRGLTPADGELSEAQVRELLVLGTSEGADDGYLG